MRPALRLSIAAVALCAATTGAAAASTADTPAPYRDDAVIVGFARGVSAVAREEAEEAAEGTEIAEPSATTRLLRVAQGKVLDAVARLRGVPGIRFAEPDYLLQEAGTPNDPSFGLQWPLRNTGQSVNGTVGVPGSDERAAAAWARTTGSRSVVVAVVDSGVEYTHPDLAANVWTNPGGVGGCAAGTHGWNAITKACDPMDDETVYGGHGTHVAGIVGAVANNGIGVAGVDWTTTILPVKWVAANGYGYTSDLISALDWVLKAKQAGVNVRVANDSEVFVGTAPSQALSDEIDLLGQNGILFVTAAGNTGENNDDPSVGRYPCRYDRPTELCVAATDQSDNLPGWANYGPTTVDLAAPGASVYSTLRGAKYGYVSGSSMAAAEVSGAAALILSQASLSTADLRADILTTVVPLPSLTGKIRTGGRLDVCRALPGCTAPPANDAFANAQTASGTAGSLPGVNFYATREAGEPAHAGSGGGQSIWYRWTAPSGGTVVFDTSGSDFDTVLAAYTGSSVGALTQVAANDDASGSDVTSRISFLATAGTTYDVAVDGYGESNGFVEQGTAVFEWSFQGGPANDPFAAAQTLSGPSGSVTGTNVGATKEAGEPNHGRNLGGQSIWYRWTAPATRNVVVDTVGSGFDTLLGVYTGSQVDGLTRIASNDDATSVDSTSQVRFRAKAGTTYSIAVDGYRAKGSSVVEEGSVVLRWGPG